jgi:alkanesulfonate monooxygenase SsuD/methylene tetrahydromethanopterin reductase-like flavin-dependent oxidoreductase (luciferase family)
LWIGGVLHKRNLDRLVRFGDAWIPIMGESVEGIASGAREARAAWKAAGRDPEQLQVQAPLRLFRGDDGRHDIARSMESVGELVAAGATDIHVFIAAFSRDPADAPRVLGELVTAFRSAT